MTDLTITDVAGNALVLKKINQDGYSGEFFKRVSPDREYRCRIRHQDETPKVGKAAMVRHNVEFTVTKFSSDPSTPDQVMQTYVVLRHPKFVSVDELKQFVLNIVFALDAPSDVQRLIDWETDIVLNGG